MIKQMNLQKLRERLINLKLLANSPHPSGQRLLNATSNSSSSHLNLTSLNKVYSMNAGSHEQAKFLEKKCQQLECQLFKTQKLVDGLFLQRKELLVIVHTSMKDG